MDINLTLDKSSVGLGNVDNTADANKPVSTAQAAAIATVQSDVDAHEARTDNPHGVTKTQVGLSNVDNTADLSKPISTATQTALDLKVDKVTGKGLSTEDYTTTEKNKLAAILGTNTGDQDLSGYLLSSTAATTYELKSSQASISASAIDWNTTHHYKTLSANTTFTFSNAADAKTIIIAITNTASNYTVTWPSAVKWAGGTEPVQTVGAKTDIYTLVQINSIIYGSYVQDLS